jgi:hypothetical protein
LTSVFANQTTSFSITLATAFVLSAGAEAIPGKIQPAQKI